MIIDHAVEFCGVWEGGSDVIPNLSTLIVMELANCIKLTALDPLIPFSLTARFEIVFVTPINFKRKNPSLGQGLKRNNGNFHFFLMSRF